MCPAGNNDYCKIIIATRVNVNTRLDIVRIFAIPLIERKLDILTRATYCIKPNEISNYIFDTIKICFNDIFLFLSLSLALEEAVFFKHVSFDPPRERDGKRERGGRCVAFNFTRQFWPPRDLHSVLKRQLRKEEKNWVNFKF